MQMYNVFGYLKSTEVMVPLPEYALPLESFLDTKLLRSVSFSASRLHATMFKLKYTLSILN